MNDYQVTVTGVGSQGRQVRGTVVIDEFPVKWVAFEASIGPPGICDTFGIKLRINSPGWRRRKDAQSIRLAIAQKIATDVNDSIQPTVGWAGLCCPESETFPRGADGISHFWP